MHPRKVRIEFRALSTVNPVEARSNVVAWPVGRDEGFKRHVVELVSGEIEALGKLLSSLEERLRHHNFSLHALYYSAAHAGLAASWLRQNPDEYHFQANFSK